MFRPPIKRPVAAVLLVLQLAGCTSWHVETLPPAELIAQKHPDRLRVVKVDGKRVMFYGPEVRGDSLRGRPRAHSTGSWTVTLDSVRSVSTMHVSAGKSIGLVLGLTAAVLLTVAASFAASFDGL